jgi:hypothetical protein
VRITTSELKDFSYCPAYYNFNTLDPILIKPITIKLHIISEVIKKSYLRTVQDKKKPDWKMIIGWIDRFVFQDLDPMDDLQFEQGKRLAESVLVMMKPWYENTFKPEEPIEGYVDLNIDTTINDVILEGNIPLLKMTDIPTITLFYGKVVNISEVFNNIDIRTLLWITCKELQLDKINIECLCFNELNGQYKSIHTSLNKRLLDRTEEVIKQLITGIKLGMNFTSRKNECTECPFWRKCSL